ncbi:MAG: DUF432 domain-containing protein [Nitrosopumilus sp.]
MSELTPNYTNYGIYDISDDLDFILPNIDIKFRNIGENVFSYFRRDSEENTVEKMIPTKNNQIRIEVAPIRPLNHPSHRTSYLYLELETPVFLSENSQAKIFARCPIEIGIFLINGENKNSLDFFTCDPINSRFGLYGTPESGTLCKYTKSEIVESYDDSKPYIDAVMEIHFGNELSRGQSISKVIFPVTDNSIYYNGSKAIYDSIDAVLKKKLTIETLDISTRNISTDWTKSPDYERKELVKRLNMGVD